MAHRVTIHPIEEHRYNTHVLWYTLVTVVTITVTVVTITLNNEI